MIHVELIFADETGAMVVLSDSDTGEILNVGVDVVPQVVEAAALPYMYFFPPEYLNDTQHFRWDRMLMERTCPHGVGHPDFDEIDLDENGRGIHGCDGCCTPGSYERLSGVVIND